ncbi:Cell division protein FtsA [Candidatus Hepatincolaceae symbiont of Richtersius coronifer]
MIAILKKLVKSLSSNVVGVMDIGDYTTSGFIYELSSKDGTYKILGSAKVLSLGFENGQVIDIHKATHTFATLLDEAEKIANCRIKNVILSSAVAASKFMIYPYFTTLNKRVDEQDISEIVNIKSIQNILKKNDFVISLRNHLMYLDDKKIDYPLGLYAKTLKADVAISMSSQIAVSNLVKILDYLSLELLALIYPPVALPYFFDNRGASEIYLDIDLNKTIIIITQKTQSHYVNISKLGLHSILSQVALKLGIDLEIFLDFYLHDNSLLNLKGKIMEITMGNKIHKINYDDLHEALDKALENFLTAIKSTYSHVKLQGDEKINISGLGSKILSLNENFVKQINIAAVKKQIKIEKQGFSEVSLEDVRAISIMKYYLANSSKLYNSKKDIGLQTFKNRIKAIAS